MQVLVTGGAGFIGSVLLSALNASGISNITIVDNLGTSEKWRNLAGKRFEHYIHKTDFLMQLESNSLKLKPDVIFHLGACSSTAESDADYLMRNNVHYSQTLCRFALKHKARFIYASSAATYGAGEHGYSDNPQELNKLRPINRYGFSKHVFDQWVAQNDLLGDVVGLKFFNVFGPNEYHKGPMISMVLRAWQQIKAHGKVELFKSNSPVFANGEQCRDFIYVKDCIDAMMSLAFKKRRIHGLFNLGTGSSRTWNDLAKAVFAAMRLQPQIEYIDMPGHLVKGYQNYTEADMSRFKTALKTTTFTPLEHGVSDYILNYLEKNLAIA